MPFRCVTGQECCNRNSFWIPPPLLKKEFNNGSILAWGDDRHGIEVGRIKKNSIC